MVLFLGKMMIFYWVSKLTLMSIFVMYVTLGLTILPWIISKNKAMVLRHVYGLFLRLSTSFNKHIFQVDALISIYFYYFGLRKMLIIF